MYDIAIVSTSPIHIDFLGNNDRVFYVNYTEINYCNHTTKTELFQSISKAIFENAKIYIANMDFTELTTPMIHEFVEKIVVHEADKSTCEGMQQIDIYLKYVGKLDIPMKELSPEEFKEEEKKDFSMKTGFLHSSLL